MKKILSLLLIIASVCLLLGSCAYDDISLFGTYVYEGEGFGSDFTITLNEDGTFSYYVGALSSYIGIGEWELDGTVICLRDKETDSYKFVNYFEVGLGELIFVEKGSSNFMYLKLKDGARFILEEE